MSTVIETSHAKLFTWLPGTHRPQGGTQPCQLPDSLPADVKPSELSHHDSHHYLSASNLPSPLLLWARQALRGRGWWGAAGVQGQANTVPGPQDAED